MEILLWLVPPVVVTVVSTLWVSWVGRERRDEVDRDAAVARLAKALEKDHPARHTTRATAERDRSRGIAVRPSRVTGPGSRRAG